MLYVNALKCCIYALCFSSKNIDRDCKDLCSIRTFWVLYLLWRRLMKAKLPLTLKFLGFWNIWKLENIAFFKNIAKVPQNFWYQRFLSKMTMNPLNVCLTIKAVVKELYWRFLSLMSILVIWKSTKTLSYFIILWRLLASRGLQIL